MTGIARGKSPETAQQFRQPNARAVVVAMSDREARFPTEKNQYRSDYVKGTKTITTRNGILRHEICIIYHMQTITNCISHAYNK